MAALSTVPQQVATRKSQIGKTGVLTLSGFGIKVRMQRGHLEIEDGVGVERRRIRLARVGRGLRRLVIIGSDGFITLEALRWLADQDAAFVMLERNGKVLCVTGPVRPSDAKLRRAQALATTNGVGLEICRALIDAKLRGQEGALRERLNCHATAEIVAHLRTNLASANSVEAIRNLEANAAASYFRVWRDLQVTWPRSDLSKIPNHWRFVGSRQSPLTGGPRLAVTPVHAILNYCFALLEAETRLALATLGLDPGLGVGLHTDTGSRDSLALDVLEAVRPQIETWLLNWIASEPLRRTDFFETEIGNCRLKSQMCAKLSDTSSMWGRLIVPWAEYVARTLSASARRFSQNSIPPTRLTQQQRRIEAKGKVWTAAIEQPKADHLCRGCGKTIAVRRTHCSHCSIDSATTRMVDAARLGRLTANSPQANKKRAHTARQNATAQHSWVASNQPPWLTDQLYSEEIQPLLANISISVIASSIGVSRCYAGNIRKGRFRPHPRHWRVLAQLAGISPVLQVS